MPSGDQDAGIDKQKSAQASGPSDATPSASSPAPEGGKDPAFGASVKANANAFAALVTLVAALFMILMGFALKQPVPLLLGAIFLAPALFGLVLVLRRAKS